jgi:hypothetical protein
MRRRSFVSDTRSEPFRLAASDAGVVFARPRCCPAARSISPHERHRPGSARNRCRLERRRAAFAGGNLGQCDTYRLWTSVSGGRRRTSCSSAVSTSRSNRWPRKSSRPTCRAGQVWEFYCECFDNNCTRRIPLTLTEYEVIRASSRRFLVAPNSDHVDTRIEDVTKIGSRYWIVEKIDEAGELAEAEDPRAT